MTVLPTRWWRKAAGIDMERNYVVVTVCIVIVKYFGDAVLRPPCPLRPGATAPFSPVSCATEAFIRGLIRDI